MESVLFSVEWLAGFSVTVAGFGKGGGGKLRSIGSEMTVNRESGIPRIRVRFQAEVRAMVNWKVLIQKTVVWVVMEILMDISGLTQIANYGEFLGECLPEQMLSSLHSHALCDRLAGFGNELV